MPEHAMENTSIIETKKGEHFTSSSEDSADLFL
jgi:hypothetical protein